MNITPYNTTESKKAQVRSMFDRIAPHYDRLNHLLSGNVDRLWRRRVVKTVRKSAPAEILDVATGTGDLAIDLAQGIPAAHIRAVDLSERMLDKARTKVAARRLDDRIALAVEDAEHLSLPDRYVDTVTAAFGVRNFGDLEAGLSEMHRVLKPQGTAVILEFSRPKNRLFRWLFESYFHRLLPCIGGAISHDRSAYTYLPASVTAFPEPDRFLHLLEGAGFRNCRKQSLTFGIAHIYTGIKS